MRIATLLLFSLAAAQPLSERGIENEIAFARLLGYVRYFHPSDQAARTDWELFAIRGAIEVEAARDAAALAAKLEALFRPIAPRVRVFPAGAAAAAAPAGPGAKLLAWRHVGAGEGHPMYRSERVEVSSALDPVRSGLPGGVTCIVPLTAAAGAQAAPPRAPLAPNERATRLAAVILAWNAAQHFSPYLGADRTAWHAALETALRSAATDPDDASIDTLRRLMAALGDGQADVQLDGTRARRAIPVLWDWIEDRLVITAAPGRDIPRGAVVAEVNGRPAAEALRARQALFSGRVRALHELAIGKAGDTIALTIDASGIRRQVSLRCERYPGSVSEPRPPNFQELEPGLVYVDLSRVNEAAWTAALPALEQARGIVFDLRASASPAPLFLSHLIDKPLALKPMFIPVVTRPDGQALEWQSAGQWSLAPRTPYLQAKRAFLAGAETAGIAELWLSVVEHSRLGTIVGAPTAGACGNPGWFTLPGGYSVGFTLTRVLKPDGAPLDRAGLKPHVPVSRTLAAVAAGRDEVLERALALLR